MYTLQARLQVWKATHKAQCAVCLRHILYTAVLQKNSHRFLKLQQWLVLCLTTLQQKTRTSSQWAPIWASFHRWKITSATNAKDIWHLLCAARLILKKSSFNADLCPLQIKDGAATRSILSAKDRTLKIQSNHFYTTPFYT